VVLSPNAGVYRSISYMQKWRVLSKGKVQRWIETVIQRLQARLLYLRREDS
jgi:hypothetical protein